MARGRPLKVSSDQRCLGLVDSRFFEKEFGPVATFCLVLPLKI